MKQFYHNYDSSSTEDEKHSLVCSYCLRVQSSQLRIVHFVHFQIKLFYIAHVDLEKVYSEFAQFAQAELPEDCGGLLPKPRHLSPLSSAKRKISRPGKIAPPVLNHRAHCWTQSVLHVQCVNLAYFVIEPQADYATDASAASMLARMTSAVISPNTCQ